MNLFQYMSTAQIFSLIRQMLLFAGGYLVSKGIIDNEGLQQLVGALMALLSSGWAIYERTPKNIVNTAAGVIQTSAGGGTITVNDPKFARDVPAPNVVYRADTIDPREREGD